MSTDKADHSLPSNAKIKNVFSFTTTVSTFPWHTVSIYRNYLFIVLWLKARTAEPEKQSLLVNGSETDNRMTSVARQQILNKQEWTAAAKELLGKHIPAAMDTRMVLSSRAVSRSYKEDNWSNKVSSVRKSVNKRVS
jgi:hypothetical protein